MLNVADIGLVPFAAGYELILSEFHECVERGTR